MNNRYFQWIVGERRGEILIFDRIEQDDGEIYITFKDNSRINEKLVAQINQRDLTGKMMAEIDSPQNCWKFVEKEDTSGKPRVEKDANSGQNYEVPPVEEITTADLTSEGGVTRPQKQSKKKKIELVPPKPTPPSHSVFGAISNVKSEPEPKVDTTQLKSPGIPVKDQTETRQIDTTDPVYILMTKAKKHDIDINMEMTVSLPPKTLYDIAKDSFDEGDVKFIDYIVDEITTDEIKEALKEAIKNMYEENSPTNTQPSKTPKVVKENS